MESFPQPLLDLIRNDDAEAVAKEIGLLRFNIDGHYDAEPDYDGAPPRTGATALVEAARNGATAVFATLLRLGANVNLCAAGGLSPLMAAIADGDHGNARRALAAGAHISARDAEGLAALDYAARTRNAALVELILSAGADPNEAIGDNDAPLAAAVAYDCAASARAILAAGARLDGARSGGAPLLAIVDWKNAALIEALLEAGADPNARDDDGRLLLQSAASRAPRCVIEKLIAYGARIPDSEDERGSLSFAAAFNRDQEAAALLDQLLSR